MNRRRGFGRRLVIDRSITDGLHIERDLEPARTLPGARLDVITPRRRDPRAPTVVTVHGFGGGRHDLTRFAVALALQGAVVGNVGWRDDGDGRDIRAAVDGIRAAIDFAHDRHGNPVTVAAWSDGALPAAVAALDTTVGRPRAAAFVGLSGYFGWPQAGVPPDLVNDRTVALFGGPPGTRPDRWEFGNAYRHLRIPLPVDFCLIVGSGDLRRLDSLRFHRALCAASFRSRLEVVDGAGHFELVTPRFAPARRALATILQTARVAVG